MNGHQFQAPTGDVYADAPAEEYFDVQEEDDDPEVITLTVDDYVDDAPLIEAPKRPKKNGEPASGPPSLAEWQDIISRIVIKTAANAYVTIMCGDLELTARELKSIQLTSEDISEMSAPMAEVANKSKFARKHGRKLIGIADSFEAVAAIVVWGRRVNRIAKRHRRNNPQQPPIRGTVINREDNVNGSAGQDGSQGFGPGGEFGDGGFHIFNPGTG